MLFRVLLGIAALFVILACAGTNAVLGTDSAVVLDVTGINGSTADDLLVSISPNEMAATSGDALSTNQPQTWGTKQIGPTMQHYTWMTISDQVPYQVWISSADNQPHDFHISLKMENQEVYTRDGTVAAGPAAKEVRIFRNSFEANHNP